MWRKTTIKITIVTKPKVSPRICFQTRHWRILLKSYLRLFTLTVLQRHATPPKKTERGGPREEDGQTLTGGLLGLKGRRGLVPAFCFLLVAPFRLWEAFCWCLCFWWQTKKVDGRKCHCEPLPKGMWTPKTLCPVFSLVCWPRMCEVMGGVRVGQPWATWGPWGKPTPMLACIAEKRGGSGFSYNFWITEFLNYSWWNRSGKGSKCQW